MVSAFHSSGLAIKCLKSGVLRSGRGGHCRIMYRNCEKPISETRTCPGGGDSAVRPSPAANNPKDCVFSATHHPRRWSADLGEQRSPHASLAGNPGFAHLRMASHPWSSLPLLRHKFGRNSSPSGPFFQGLFPSRLGPQKRAKSPEAKISSPRRTTGYCQVKEGKLAATRKQGGNSL